MTDIFENYECEGQLSFNLEGGVYENDQTQHEVLPAEKGKEDPHDRGEDQADRG